MHGVNCRASFSAFMWTQEQAEKLLVKCVEQSKLAREQAQKMLDETGKQVRENQNQVQKLMTDSVETALAQWGFITKTQQEEVQRRIDELSAKLDNWRN